MGFLSPWFFAGLAAVGLPVWLHLLRRHRSEPRLFSSLMFFERHTQSSIKHRRLMYLFLLSLRIALLALLVLAFANPYIIRSGAAGSGERALELFVVDHSFSMREGGSLERAKRQALDAIAAMPGGAQGQAIALGSGVELLSQPTAEREQLRAAVQAIQPGDSRSAYAELARAVRSIAESSRMPVRVHLFSDMQRSSLPPSFSDLALPAGASMVVHSVADATRPNWAVESVNAPRRISDPKKARVQATIAGYGTPAARREVSLVVNGRVIATRTADLGPNGRATVEFVGVDAPHGLNRGEVRISPADTLGADDAFYFPVERADPRRILFVHEARQPRGLLYFGSALEASSAGAFAVDAVTADQAGNLAPEKFAAVVLSDVAAVPPSLDRALKSYVRGGGSVLIALGVVSATRPRVPVSNEAIVESRYATRSGERFLSAGEMDAAHPVLKDVNRFSGVKFFQAVRVEPGSSRVLARLSDGTPLLLESKMGEGRVMVFTSTFDNLSNDLPLHVAFVPFAAAAARYLTGEEDRPGGLPVDGYVDLRTAKDAGAAVEVLDPDGKRALSLQESATARTFRVNRTGHYEIRRGNGRNEMIAVNADRRESDLDVIPKETLALWQGTGGAPGSGLPGGGAERRQSPLWWYILLLAAAIALCESWVATRHFQTPDGKEERDALARAA